MLEILRVENGFIRYRLTREGQEPEENKYPAEGVIAEARKEHKSRLSVLAARLGIDKQPEQMIEAEEDLPEASTLTGIIPHTHREFSFPLETHEHEHSHEETATLTANLREFQEQFKTHGHKGFAYEQHEHRALEESIVRSQADTARLGIELSRAVERLSEQANAASEQAAHAHPGMARQEDIDSLKVAVQSLLDSVNSIQVEVNRLRTSVADQMNRVTSEVAAQAAQSYAPAIHAHDQYAMDKHGHDHGNKRVWIEVSRQDVNGKDYLTLEPAP